MHNQPKPNRVIRMTNIHFLQFVKIVGQTKTKELDKVLSREDAAFLIEERDSGKDNWSTLTVDEIVAYARTGDVKKVVVTT